jgi:N-acetylneuraminic acid mutarotase
MDLNYTFSEAGQLSFYWKVDSEEAFDYLLFCYDNDLCTDVSGYRERISGDQDWARVSIPVTAGAHSFRWQYIKDSSADEGADMGWIDNVQFTAGGGTGTIRGDTLQLIAADSVTLQTSGNDSALTVNSDGEVIFGAVNSTSAFQIQNSSGGSLMNIDASYANASILGLNSGGLAPWTEAGNELPAAGYGGAAVTANGYIYAVGGNNASHVASTTVSYAKLNSDGSVGSWASGTALPAGRTRHATVVANGHIYVIGGEVGGVPQSTIYYAKINNNGSIGAWKTGSPIGGGSPVPRTRLQAFVAGGFLYVIGGHNGTSMQDTVYFAGLGTDGAVGTWNTDADVLPAVRGWGSVVTANGYVYLMGGTDNTTPSNVVYYAPLEGSAGLGSWSTTEALPSARIEAVSVAANGHIYAIGGNNGGYQSTVYYTKANNDGTLGDWAIDTNTPLPGARASAAAVTANGYIYVLGGFGGSGANDTVYYTSTSRLQLGASLDLVGLQNQNLADSSNGSLGSIGGGITAGNGVFVGNLQVQGETSLNGAVSMNSGLNVGGGVVNGSFDFKMGTTDQVSRGDTGLSRALVKDTGGVLTINYANDYFGGVKVSSNLIASASALSTTAFSVINGSTPRFVVDTTNSRVHVGNPTADSVGTIFVLDNKDGTDPTGVEGAMYYNSDSESFRCYRNTSWVACTGGMVFSTTAPSSAIASTASETNFNQTYTVPANECKIGHVYRVTAQGIFSSTGTPTLVLRLKFGAAIMASKSGTVPSGSSSIGWRLEGQFTCNADPGAASAIESQGMVLWSTSNTALGINGSDMRTTTTTNVATNASQTIQLSATWGTSSASNTITMRQLIVEKLED